MTCAVGGRNKFRKIVKNRERVLKVRFWVTLKCQKVRRQNAENVLRTTVSVLTAGRLPSLGYGLFRDPYY